MASRVNKVFKTKVKILHNMMDDGYQFAIDPALRWHESNKDKSGLTSRFLKDLNNDTLNLVKEGLNRATRPLNSSPKLKDSATRRREKNQFHLNFKPCPAGGDNSLLTNLDLSGVVA